MEEKMCCPKFKPDPWQETCFTWNEKPFLMDRIPQFMHMPLPGVYSKAIERMMKRAQSLGVATEAEDFMLLAYDPSPWKSELFMSITKPLPEVGVVKFNGTYVSKVFDGPYSDVPKYVKEMENYLKRIGRTAIKMYFYYTTCPKCAKKYGHNYIVAIAEVS